MKQKFLSLLLPVLALCWLPFSASAQVSLHGVYGSALTGGPTVLFAVHDNNSVGVFIWDFTSHRVGRAETPINASGTFTVANLIGYSVNGTLTSAGPSSTPSITGSITSGSNNFTLNVPRTALFGAGNSLNFEGRFEGIASQPSGLHRTRTIFFVDANMNLYFAHLLVNGTYVGGTGTVSPNATNDGGTFTAMSVNGTQISGSFSTDGYVMDGTFTADGLNYEFQAYRVGAASRLNNISTRGFVGTGSQVLIGGFSIGGAPKLVYIRVLGPTLTTYGVDGALQAPTVSLNLGQKVIASNTGWKTAPNSDQIAKTPWPPASDGDCAILTVLESGAYTLTVQGVNATTGVALVEVYELGVH